MKISILNVDQMDLTDAIRGYVQKKTDMLDKFVHHDDGSAHVDVLLGRGDKHHQKGESVYYCELNLHIAGKDFHLKADEADLYAAIDLAKDEMSRVLRQHRKKEDSLFKRGGRRIKALLRGFGK